MKFLCDQMLGSLAKWLRLLGYDTFYASVDMSDDELLEIAKHEQRVLVTRDKELVERAKKHDITCVALQTTNLDEQLIIVLGHVSDASGPQILTRCTVCNSVLQKIDKDTVQHLVPPRVFEHQDQFWFCPQCMKYYWMGSHYQNIIEKITKLSKQGS